MCVCVCVYACVRVRACARVCVIFEQAYKNNIVLEDV